MPTQLNSWNADKLEPAIYPELARTIAAQFPASTTIAKGTVLGKVTASGKLAAYNDSNTDGTETAVAISVYDVITDSAGKHYLGDSAVANPSNLPLDTVPVYIGGIFDPADLTGENANGLTDLNARTLPNGFISIPL